MPSLDLPAPYLAELQALLLQHIPAAEVWAFGSRVHGSAHEGSDLDLVVRNPLNPGMATEQLGALQAALQASRIPFLVDIHDWANLPPAFHQQIRQAYYVLQSPPPAA